MSGDNFVMTGLGRVALVHDWLVGQRGGEQVLLQLCRMYPAAEIFTLVHEPGSVHADIEAHPIHTSFVQRLRTSGGRFRHLLPLFPAAIAAFDMRRFDLVISTSHCVAHGIVTAPGTVHIAYVHTPMRYLYDQLPHYLPGRGRAITAPMARAVTLPLRRWDAAAAKRPTSLVANSAYVAARIQRVWRRQAAVVHPPVDTQAFVPPATEVPGGRRGLLWVGALVPYKRVDLCVALSAAMGVPLTVVGRGPDEARLRAMAGHEVRFLHDVPHEQLQALYASHEALMYPGEEDFGIVPVEAMAAGCPVLGLSRGGLLETVRTRAPFETGVLVGQATVPAFAAGLQQLRAIRERGGLRPGPTALHAQRFGTAVFCARMHQAVRAAWPLRYAPGCG